MKTVAGRGVPDRLRTESELRWTMPHVARDRSEQRSKEYSFDFTELVGGYSLPFLIAVKAALINSRNRVSNRTIFNEYCRLKAIFQRFQDAGLATNV